MKIAIVAYGVEGQASYRYYSKDPLNDITIFDQNPALEAPEGVKTVLGPDAFEKLQDYDLILRSPPIPRASLKTNGKIWSATNEFFEKCPAKIIGVTGTKGKGTTASLIAAIFEAAGKTVWLVGNIGVAAVDMLDKIQPDDIVVYELSSFQLWDLERSPQTAVVLLIEPDHLNVHDDMEDYVSAKGAIRRFQGDDGLCVYHPTNHYSRDIAHNNEKGKIVRYGIKDDGGVSVVEGSFVQNEHIICSVDALQLIGVHNQENACAAITVALAHGISDEAIEKGLLAFKGLPHRTEFVREFEGVEYYNDSFSSAPAATVAAIKSFTQPEIVIIGGIDKGGDFAELYAAIRAQTNIKELVIIGEIRHKLHKGLHDAGVSAPATIFDGKTMPEIVDYARSRSESGDVVLLSPACASFDMFKDFYDRGNQFREYVNSL